MSYQFKVWVVNYTQFKRTQNILNLYNPLDNKKLVSTYFNLSALKMGQTRFRSICPEYTLYLKMSTSFEYYYFKFNRNVLNFLLYGCRVQYERRVKNHPIDSVIYPEEVFREVINKSMVDKYSFQLPLSDENDLELTMWENANRQELFNNSPHRYRKYIKIWKNIVQN